MSKPTLRFLVLESLDLSLSGFTSFGLSLLRLELGPKASNFLLRDLDLFLRFFEPFFLGIPGPLICFLCSVGTFWLS